ncbi:MAG: hypothetical protein R3283_06805 [Balneolaceae bacterium]|nr:hypothetical protein [Balneolaceae bacterium]
MTFIQGRFFPVLLILIFFVSVENSLAQIEEPEVLPTPRQISSLESAYDAGFGIGINMNNFGFGLAAEYRNVIAPETELVAKLGITGLRDASEQTFTDIFFGQQIVPNKYQRGFAFPLMAGFRKRVFSDVIQENYRFFVSALAGGVASFTYPYFDDINDNGYREQFIDFFEPVNDVFTGWGEGKWHLGGAGELKLGVDIGRNATRLNSVEFGYYFYYFPDGIQMMMPTQPVLNPDAAPGQNPFLVDQNGELVLQPFFDPQKFFGTPQITFTFGWLW